MHIDYECLFVKWLTSELAVSCALSLSLSLPPPLRRSKRAKRNRFPANARKASLTPEEMAVKQVSAGLFLGLGI